MPQGLPFLVFGVAIERSGVATYERDRVAARLSVERETEGVSP